MTKTSRSLNRVVSSLLPPIVRQLLLRLGLGGSRFIYGFKSWDDARSNCRGYDSNQIADALVEASRKVRDGEAAFERDGVVFERIEYSWPLLAAILGTATPRGSLRVLDFGGSLGTTYRQIRGVIEGLGIDLNWVIVEQAHLVKIGNSEFKTEKLTFSGSLEGYRPGEFDLILLASSICYVKEPMSVLSQIKALNPFAIAIDRTPISKDSSSQIGIQEVKNGSYEASYPISVFAPGALEEAMEPEYKKVFDWECELQPDPQTLSKGFFFVSTKS